MPSLLAFSAFVKIGQSSIGSTRGRPAFALLRPRLSPSGFSDLAFPRLFSRQWAIARGAQDVTDRDSILGQGKGAVRDVVGIDDGVVSGDETQSNPGVGAPVETTPWAILA